MIRVLRHEDVLADGDAFLLSRVTLNTRRPRYLHGHNFYELLWVQNGTMRHHSEEGKIDLGEGAMIFIRPGDTHAIQGRGEDSMVVSLSLRPQIVEDLFSRHPGLEGRFFWSATGPDIVRRDVRQMADINRAALFLERGSRTALQAEAFLTPVLAELQSKLPELPPDAPNWLVDACIAAMDPRVFREGAAGLAAAAGRAHPHVSRTMRRFMGQSPSDYINAQRMNYASRQLIGTEDSLAEIAADCGIPNLSHFHKLFRNAYGTSPQKYRRARQSDVVQPD